MRLIDADVLLGNVKRAVYTDDLNTTIAVDICKSHIVKMPTIDAIPVEWLWAAQDKMLESPRFNFEQCTVVGTLIWEWQKEREAQK